MSVRDAATVMLVRDGADGLEVFMLRRNLNSDFVGGAYVFPGGAVDEEDRHAHLERVCRGRSDDQASNMLGIDTGGLAFWVAAIRRTTARTGGTSSIIPTMSLTKPGVSISAPPRRIRKPSTRSVPGTRPWSSEAWIRRSTPSPSRFISQPPRTLMRIRRPMVLRTPMA